MSVTGGDGHMDRVVERANRLLERMCRDEDGAPRLPIDLDQAALLAGLRIVVLPGGLAGHVVRNQTGVPVSGLLDFERGRILIDGRESLARRRFTIAHEIGHEVLGHEAVLGSSPHAVFAEDAVGGEPEDAADPGSGPASGARASVEIEADCFAGALLVPSERLQVLVEQFGPNVPLLAHVFGVSCAAMRRHLVPWLPHAEDVV